MGEDHRRRRTDGLAAEGHRPVRPGVPRFSLQYACLSRGRRRPVLRRPRRRGGHDHVSGGYDALILRRRAGERRRHRGGAAGPCGAVETKGKGRKIVRARDWRMGSIQFRFCFFFRTGGVSQGSKKIMLLYDYLMIFKVFNLY
jgi:hypothetical protein